MPEEARVRTVLMTADTVGGVFSYAMLLATELGRAGVRTILAIMGEPMRAGQREEAARIQGLEVFESDSRLEWMDDPWRDVARAGDWLLALEERTRPDVV